MMGKLHTKILLDFCNGRSNIRNIRVFADYFLYIILLTEVTLIKNSNMNIQVLPSFRNF